MTLRIFVIVLVFALPPALSKSETAYSGYFGEHDRPIKSLSLDDIAELERGGGWGLAKAAELNGVPGPAHLIELKDDIPLLPQQLTNIRTIYLEMNEAAIAAGQRLILAEAALDRAFRVNELAEAELHELLDRIAISRRDLRFIHLSAHMTVSRLLTYTQISKYNQLRGYHDDNCEATTKRHNTKMWRLHNNC